MGATVKETVNLADEGAVYTGGSGSIDGAYGVSDGCRVNHEVLIDQLHLSEDIGDGRGSGSKEKDVRSIGMKTWEGSMTPASCALRRSAAWAALK